MSPLSATDITRHYDEGEVLYVDAYPTPGYVLTIEEPDPAWVQRWLAVESLVRGALDDRVLELQHVGSTSVAGLPAKPIVDVDLVVPDPADEAAYVPALQALGFVHWLTEPDWHQHRLLKLLDEPRVHLHVFGPDCPEVVRHRMFRDWLREHQDDRELYAAAKRAAVAEMATSDIEPGALGHGMAYNRIKEPLVRELYDRIFRAAGLLG